MPRPFAVCPGHCCSGILCFISALSHEHCMLTVFLGRCLLSCGDFNARVMYKVSCWGAGAERPPERPTDVLQCRCFTIRSYSQSCSICYSLLYLTIGCHKSASKSYILICCLTFGRVVLSLRHNSRFTDRHLSPIIWLKTSKSCCLCTDIRCVNRPYVS